ncbi:MAG: hypothetical protein U5K84_11250 [Alkalibacterium sp.]|nr:hypothetical protein [Alkalibacterium sp.]
MKYIFSIVDDPYSDQNELFSEERKSWIKKLFDKFNLLSRHEKALLEKARKQKEELHQVTYFDMLTKLPNRTKLHKDFEVKLVKHDHSTEYPRDVDLCAGHRPFQDDKRTIRPQCG